MDITQEPTTSTIVRKAMQRFATVPETPLESAAEKDEAPTGQTLQAEAVAEVAEPEPDMAALMAEYEQTTQRGQIITGRVVKVERDGVYIDVGMKSDGLVPRNEWDPDDEPKPGDTVEVLLLKAETEEKPAVLSKRRADYEKNWLQLLEAYQNGRIVEALVKDAVKGGLVVDLGVEGFVPASQVLSKKRDLSVLIGHVLKLKIIDVDKKRNKLILSNRQAIEEERERRRSDTWARLEPGSIVEGIVRRITDFGAFVDLGGVDGLLHVSDIAWTRVSHPREAVKVGQKLQVLVQEVDREHGKVTLGLKQLLPDPWKKVAKHYRTGKIVKGTVTRIVPACAFVHLEDGIDGIVPISEVSDQRLSSPDEVLTVGQEVEVKVLQVRARQRRMTLSLKEAEREKERREYRDFMNNQKAGTVTLGEVFGSLLTETSTPSSEESSETQAETAAETVDKPVAEAVAEEIAQEAHDTTGLSGCERPVCGDFAEEGASETEETGDVTLESQMPVSVCDDTRTPASDTVESVSSAEISGASEAAEISEGKRPE